VERRDFWREIFFIFFVDRGRGNGIIWGIDKRVVYDGGNRGAGNHIK
jgi:hypothetical protein